MTDITTMRPCPHCASKDLIVVDWYDEEREPDCEFDAIECRKCLAAAPAEVWNQRAA